MCPRSSHAAEFEIRHARAMTVNRGVFIIPPFPSSHSFSFPSPEAGKLIYRQHRESWRRTSLKRGWHRSRRLAARSRVPTPGRGASTDALIGDRTRVTLSNAVSPSPRSTHHSCQTPPPPLWPLRHTSQPASRQSEAPVRPEGWRNAWSF